MIRKSWMTAVLLVGAVTIASPRAQAFFEGIWQRESLFPESTDPNGRPQLRVAAFGDSILSGLDVDNWWDYIHGMGLVERVGKKFSKAHEGTSVFVDNRSVAGSHSITITNSILIDGAYARAANFILLDGGGNDFLDVVKLTDDQICEQTAVNNVVQETTKNWNQSVRNIQRLNTTSRNAFLTLHFGNFDNIKSRSKCRDGVTSPYSIAFAAVTKMNYLVGQLATQTHADVLDVFGLFNCGPAIRAICDPRFYPTYDAYLAQLQAWDQVGWLSDASRWKNDDTSAPISLLQSDLNHPNEEGHRRLAIQLFDIITIAR